MQGQKAQVCPSRATDKLQGLQGLPCQSTRIIEGLGEVYRFRHNVPIGNRILNTTEGKHDQNRRF